MKRKIKSLILVGAIASGVIFGGTINSTSNISYAASSISQSVKQTATTTSALKMRRTNSTKGKVLVTLKKGAKVDVLKKMSNGWYQVKSGSKTGYVDGKYLKITTIATKKVGITKSALKMRSTNSTKGKVLVTLKKGAKVDVLKKMSNGWYQVKSGSKTGYVDGKYLTIKTETVKPATYIVLKNKIGTTTAKTNMRSTNSTKGKVVVTLKKGAKVDALKKMSNGWYQVKSGSKTGYVEGKYLKITDKKVTNPKPEVVKPSGISFEDFRGRLASMGWTYGTTNTYNFIDTSINRILGSVRADSTGVYFLLQLNSPQFDSVIKQCFNLLLPTQGGRLYNIVSNPFSNQTLTMDGRTVTISQGGAGVSVTIVN